MHREEEGKRRGLEAERYKGGMNGVRSREVVCV